MKQIICQSTVYCILLIVVIIAQWKNINCGTSLRSVSVHFYISLFSIFLLCPESFVSAELIIAKKNMRMWKRTHTHRHTHRKNRNSAIELLQCSGHPLPVTDNNRKWLTRPSTGIPSVEMFPQQDGCNWAHTECYDAFNKICFGHNKQDTSR